MIYPLPDSTEGSIIIFKKEGETLVPLIKNKESFDYQFIHSFAGEDFCEDLEYKLQGFLNGKGMTFEEYEIKQLKKEEEENREKIEEVEEYYKQARDKAYFDNTHYLVVEYHKACEAYEKYKQVANSHKKGYYNDPIYRHWRDFPLYHPEINNPLDIRFNRFYYEELVHDPNRPDVKMISHFYDPHPDVDFDTYRDFVDFAYPHYLERIKSDFTSELAIKKQEFTDVKESLKEALTKRDKVGLVYLHPNLHMVYEEVAPRKIDELTIDEWAHFSLKKIYWFTK